MAQLVYHDLSNTPGLSSPFDEAILKVSAFGTVSIVSPYIGVDYLQRIIHVSEAWRLISDVEAWLSSLSIRARPKAWQFIRENLDRIHHCPAIHAKVVVGQGLAMLGSANLTNAGILGRTEMGILIDDPELVAELNRWFDTLWTQTHPPTADETSAFIKWLDDDAKRSPARREKFSLSASGRKIRARLVKLSTPISNEIEGAGIHLEDIAQELITREQRHYESLVDALEAAINIFADTGFTLRHIVESICQEFPDSTVREIYFALLQYCANHVRSVFAENTRNRLILENGRFRQSSKESIHQALAPFDNFLEHLVHRFDFSGPRDMPHEDELLAITGIRIQDQTILISDLLDCGFLEIMDIAGQLPQYSLSDVFEWSGRYKLFAKALLEWKAKKNRFEQRTEGSNQKDSDKSTNSEVLRVGISDVFGDSSIEPFFDVDKMSLSDFLRIENEKMQKAEKARIEKLAINRQNRHDGIDKILAHLLTRLLSAEGLLPIQGLLLGLPAELGVNPKWVREVLRGVESDIPKVIVATKKAVSINPRLDWNDLADFPRTQSVCKSFLEI